MTRVGDLTTSLTVNFVVGGTATNGVDYLPIGGTATFAAGSNTVTIAVNVTNDSFIEGTESVGITLSIGAGYVLTPANSAVVALNDNDTPFHGYATSTAGGPASDIRIFNEPNAPPRVIEPFKGYAGGVVIAAGDVNGDGIADYAVGVAGGAAPHIKVFDGATGAELVSFFAYDTRYLGGVTVALADLDGDGRAEIITGAKVGVSHVKVFDGLTGAELRSFYAYTNADGSPTPSGVTVAAGDLDGDGRAEIITGANSIAPHVKAFDLNGREVRSFYAFDFAQFPGGVSVAAGDLDGDGRAEIVAGVSSNGQSLLNVFYSNGAIRGPIGIVGTNEFGPSIAVGDIAGPGRELFVAIGPKLSIFDGVSLAISSEVNPYAAYNGSVYLGA